MKKILNALLVISLLLSLAVTAEAKDTELSVTLKQVCAGDHFSAAIMEDGSLWVWGEKYYAPTTPTKVMDNVRNVSCDADQIAVITNDNVLWYIKIKSESFWNGKNWEPTDPTICAPERRRENVLSYSAYFDSFITTDYELRRFVGSDEWFIATDVVSATGLAHGFYGSGYAIVRSDGSLWISGVNYYGDGQEKHEENDSASHFTKIMDGVRSVSGNSSTIAVIKEDRSLWMWGENTCGDLGNGNTDRSLTPVKVLEDVIAVDWGESSTYHHYSWGALKPDGSLWMWGDCSFLRFSNDNRGLDSIQATPVEVLDNVVSFSCGGGGFTLAVRSDGSLWGWGSSYQFGNIIEDLFSGDYRFRPVAPFKLFDGVALPDGVSVAPSSWAEAEVNDAIAAGLVPENLQKNYTWPVSRGDVAQMFINLIEQSSGKPINEFMGEMGVEVNPSAFTDTSDKAVLAANALGIIQGIGNNKFDPDGTFTRAQIAAIINRIARVLGVDTDGYSHIFSDVVGHWVDSELGWPSSVGIINGVGNNQFSPDTELTTEQAIAITYRALQVLKQ